MLWLWQARAEPAPGTRRGHVCVGRACVAVLAHLQVAQHAVLAPGLGQLHRRAPQLD
jgi:hypothetical protein